MRDLVIVRRGTYHDSVALMLVSRVALAAEGVSDAVVAMATPLNLELLAARAFALGDAGELTVNDLVIAVRCEDGDTADRVLAVVEHELSSHTAAPTASVSPVSLVAASRRRPELSVALLSVPGRHAAYEAAAALEAGLHVFCFSNGVGLEEEVALKRRAQERGLLFMGPDCGTAILDGVALGFANAVARGPVGIVGASGTGIQEVCCLLDLAGVGISHAIGVGGRDLGRQVGGAMLRRGLDLLAEDDGTRVIVAISKPPDPAVAGAIVEHAATTGKTVVLAFPGLEGRPLTPPGVEHAAGLEAAAARAAELVGHTLPPWEGGGPDTGARGAIRGLYSGGTLCTEAMTVVSGSVGRVMSNIPLRPEWRLPDLNGSDGHAFIDFGADELTLGRPHPMIDQTLRLERLALEARDPKVAAIMLDLVLGYAAHPDPAAELAPVIARARSGRDELAIIVSVCGTARDPQGLERQRELLLAAGAMVTRGAAHAARLALHAAG
jgi:FdrA protein